MRRTRVFLSLAAPHWTSARRTFSQLRRKLVGAGQRLEERSGPVIWIETFPGPKEIALIEEILASNAELRDLTRVRDRQHPSTGRKR